MGGFYAAARYRASSGRFPRDDARSKQSALPMKRIVPLVLTVAIFVVIFLRIPFGRLVDDLAHARLMPFLTLMASFSIAFFAIDTLVLTTMVRWFHGPLPYRDLLPVRASTYLVSIVNTQLALPLFGIHIPTLRLLAFLPIVFMVAALPLTVAHLGTSQAAWIYFFSDYAPEADLLAYSLAAHLTFMLANGALGLLFLPKAYADLFVHGRQDDIGRARPDQKTASV